MASAFIALAGASDLFLSLILWFIFDDAKKPVVLVDGDRVYAVEQVLATDQT